MGLDVSERDHKFRGEARRTEQETLLVRMDGVEHFVDLERDSTEALAEMARRIGLELVSLRNHPDLRRDRELSKRENVMTAYYHRINQEVTSRRRMSRNESSRTWLLRFFRLAAEKLPAEVYASLVHQATHPKLAEANHHDRFHERGRPERPGSPCAGVRAPGHPCLPAAWCAPP